MENFDIASYADDTTPFVTGTSFEEVKSKIEDASKKLFNWLSVNQMKGNAQKCHLITNSEDINQYVVIESEKIQNSQNQKLLGVSFDNKLKFDIHLKNVCKTAGMKISALVRLSPFMNISKWRLI